MVCVEVTSKVQKPSCFLQVAEKAAWIERHNRHRVAEMIGHCSSTANKLGSNILLAVAAHNVPDNCQQQKGHTVAHSNIDFRYIQYDYFLHEIGIKNNLVKSLSITAPCITGAEQRKQQQTHGTDTTFPPACSSC